MSDAFMWAVAYKYGRLDYDPPSNTGSDFNSPLSVLHSKNYGFGTKSACAVLLIISAKLRMPFLSQNHSFYHAKLIVNCCNRIQCLMARLYYLSGLPDPKLE